MNFEKLTEKTKTFLTQAQTLAARSDHQSLEPEHVLKVMLDDADAITKTLVQAAGGDFARLRGDVDGALAKLPQVTGRGAGQIRLSSDLAKIVDKAQTLAEKSGDSFVTVERLLQGMILSKRLDVSGYLEDAGLSDEALNRAVNDMRKGRTADSATAEDQFEALKKYAHDLTQAAREGKLDPIIGRDEEIRRTV